MARALLFRIRFVEDKKILTLYAEQVLPSNLPGFIEVSGLQLGNQSTVLIDPAVEQLRLSFADVSSFQLPHYAILRIDRVKHKAREIQAQSLNSSEANKITPFPSAQYAGMGASSSTFTAGDE